MVNIMDIEGPDFLKDMDRDSLSDLAADIRKFLITQLSKTGGHFSSNMGIVELTIALHKVFESPKDQLIFDVGHQGYVHKILTGRAPLFNTLRQTDGLSGFLKREESVHDCYEAGHSSTSIAAAAGMLFAKPHNPNVGNIIALIGDGSLNSGAALEALNFLGQYPDKNPIIVLNDNEMSITENVGHLSKMLTQIRMKRSYRHLRKSTSKVIPRRLKPFTSKIEKRLKGFIQGSTYFETLGYDYYGPIDGHNFKHLIKAFEVAKSASKPTVIHVKTIKGKGYTHAENDLKGSWHGVKPFDSDNGVFNHHPTTTKKTYSKIVAQYLEAYAKEHKDFYVITPAMVGGSELHTFKNNYPEQLIDTGIAEATSVTLGGALAMKEVNVFLSIYSTFLQRAYDQVIHDVARQDANLIIGIDRAGLVGADGETHQGIYDIPMLSHIPNMTIAHPKDAHELHQLFDYAFNIHKGPIAIRYPRVSVEVPPKKTDDSLLEPAWEIITQGNQGSIITFGEMVNQLRTIIEKNNLDITLVNARFIKPLDTGILNQIDLEKPVITYEESTITGGLGSMILSHFASVGSMPKQYKMLGFNDAFVPQGSPPEMLKRYGLDADSVIATLNRMLDNEA